MDKLNGTTQPRSGRLRHKRGLPPGSVVYIGQERTEHVKLSEILFSPDHMAEREIETSDACHPAPSPDQVQWLNIDGIHDVQVIEAIGRNFQFHPLMLEDIANSQQRPKIEEYDKALFIVLKMLRLNSSGNRIIAEQVSLILGTNYVISFQELEGDVFDPIRTRIREKKGRVRNHQADYLAYALLDAIVDGYYLVLESLGDRVTAMETEIMRSPAGNTLERLHSIKRDMIFVRRAVWPMRDLINALLRDERDRFQPGTQIFLRDVYDHIVHIMETLDSHRDILSGLTDLYLSIISNRMNEVMKVLTIIATIFIPLTFVAGIYGMNFRQMPELDQPWGYPAVLLLMLLMTVALLLFFKRRKWL